MVANIPPIEDANAAGPAAPPDTPTPDMAQPARETPDAAPDPALSPPDTPTPEPEEETAEQFMRRLVEENSWRMKPRPPRPVPPPEPKSIHLMTPEEMHESLPVHLRRRRPDGSYYAMGLISRMQRDLEELTQGKRAATYPEVDEYLGYALLAEGLAPRGYSAAEATRWWKMGGSQVLWDSTAASQPLPPNTQNNLVPDTSALVPAGPTAIEWQPDDRAPPASAIPTATSPDPANARSSAQGAAAQFDLGEETMTSLQRGAAAENLVSAPTQRFMSALGAAEADNFGYLAEKYETSNQGPGTISSGKDDPGGASYGSYQLSSTKGKLQEFLLSEENLWAKELAGLTPVTPAFDKAWKTIAKREPELFRNAQFAFMYRTNYLKTVAKVEKLTDVDLDSFSSAVRAAVFSTVNQHGKASKPLTWAINATNQLIKADDPAYEETLIRQIYAQRARYVLGVAKNNKNPGEKKQLQSLVKKRYVPEEADALAQLQSGT
jgi:hypothetical protein